MKRNTLAGLIPLACAGALLVIGGCSSIPKSTRQALEKPVDCATAEEDLIELAAGLPSGRKKARAVVTSLIPAGLVVGVVSRDLRNRAKVVNGTLEADIYNKMADINDECDLAIDDTP